MFRKNFPKVRFKSFDGDWEEKKLKRIVERVTRKNSDLISERALTISAQHGLVDQEDFFNKKIASKDVSGYYLIKNGEFAYNKSYSNGYPLGAIKRLDKYEYGVLSTLYILFKPFDINSDFLACYYESIKWHKEVSMCAAEGARNHGLLNISPQDFFNTNLFISSNKNEQSAIGTLFQTLDELLSAYKDNLANYQAFKATMLSKMFPKAGQTTPEIRLDGFDCEWEKKTLGDVGSVSMNKRIFKDETSENGDIPFFKIGTFGGEADSFITRAKFKEYRAKYPYPEIGDILISASGSIGRTVEYRGEEAYFQDSNIVWLNHNGKLDNQFLKQFYSIVKWSGIEGTTIKRLYNKNILETTIFVPELEEQRAIGAFFANLDDLIASQQAKITELETLKKKLLQDMFL